jgi:DNA end-binding protein Ku
VALARTVLFRRVRTILIRPFENGLMATTLKFDYEVRAADEIFDSAPKIKIGKEMLDLAQHIIKMKRGSFDPAKFDDRYENALAALVKAKVEGKPIPKRKPEPTGKVVDLLQALRDSAGSSQPSINKRAPRKAAGAQNKKAIAHPRRKAG